jgi:3',5'-cyclic AMP phosphodiesterase CpdA
MKILHVSDVHFGCDTLLGEQKTITQALIRDAHAHARKTRKPDLCIFSGDLAQRGTRQQLDEGAKWLASLIAPWDCVLFVVPGNHEVQRPEKDSEAQRQVLARRQAVAVSEKAYQPQRASLEEGKLLDEFFAWHEAARQQLQGLVSDWRTSRMACRHTGAFQGVKTHVVGLNTALASCDDDDRGKLVADLRMLNTLLEDTDSETELIVVVTHHPLTLPGVRAERWLARWNNQALANRLLQKRGPHLYLHGHVHRLATSSTSNNSGQQLAVFGAGAAYQGSKYPQRFAFYDIDLETREIVPATFNYETRSGEWILSNADSLRMAGPLSLPKPGARAARSLARAEESGAAPTAAVAQNPNHALLEKAYDHSVRSISRLIANLYPIRPGKDRLRHHFSKITSATVIGPNGDGAVTNTFTIVAGPQPVHFLKTWIRVEEDSPPVPHLVGAQVEIRDISPQSKYDVVFLPARDDGHEKEVSIFFLPSIPPRGRRTIEFRFQWPRYLKRLIDGKTVEFAWGYPTGFPKRTTALDLSVEFHRDLGRIRCDNKTVGDTAATLREERIRRGATRWVYRHPRASLAKGAVMLTFDRATP